MLKKPGLDRDDIIQFAPKTLAFRKGEGNIPGKDGIFPKTEFFQIFLEILLAIPVFIRYNESARARPMTFYCHTPGDRAPLCRN